METQDIDFSRIPESDMPNAEGIESRQSTWKLGFCNLYFGISKEKLEQAVKSNSFLFGFSGPEPRHSGKRVSIFTFGIKVIQIGKRTRLGFIRRKQVLEKV